MPRLAERTCASPRRLTTAASALVQHPDLGERITALATSWGWVSGEVRMFALATLDMLAGQLAAGRVEDDEAARPRR